MTSVAVCIASYRRPDGLRALLGALDGQTFADAAPGIRVVVVDNDPDASARPVCDAARRCLRHPLHYVHEPRTGIPVARNRAVAEAGDADWLAFVDDDEVPPPGWLDALLRAQRTRAADVVTGPVVPRFDVPPPAWVVAGRFFESEPLADGALRDTAYTHNVLVRASLLAGLPAPFDERLVPNGEDTELFDRLARAGARIVWACDAVVEERVPAERATLRWVVGRAFHVGVAASRIARLRGSRLRAAPRAVAHGVWCLGRGGVTALLGVGAGGGGRARGLRLASFGIGRLAGWALP